MFALATLPASVSESTQDVGGLPKRTCKLPQTDIDTTRGGPLGALGPFPFDVARLRDASKRDDSQKDDALESAVPIPGTILLHSTALGGNPMRGTVRRDRLFTNGKTAMDRSRVRATVRVAGVVTGSGSSYADESRGHYSVGGESPIYNTGPLRLNDGELVFAHIAYPDWGKTEWSDLPVASNPSTNDTAKTSGDPPVVWLNNGESVGPFKTPVRRIARSQAFATLPERLVIALVATGLMAPMPGTEPGSTALANSGDLKRALTRTGFYAIDTRVAGGEGEKAHAALEGAVRGVRDKISTDPALAAYVYSAVSGFRDLCVGRVVAGATPGDQAVVIGRTPQ